MKKRYAELSQVKEFMAQQPVAVLDEYRGIVRTLETQGYLEMPMGEKITGMNLFAIRVIQAGNVRVFYCYGKGDKVYGIHGYVKKTQRIPRNAMAQAEKMMKVLLREGMLK